MAEESPRILIVDDDIDFASLLADVFSQASYEVEMTGDPTVVEEQVRSMDFNLVVTDLRMPGMNGFELAKKVKAIKPDLPIIMVSGFLDSKDREKMEAEGIVGLYEKPLSVFSLLKNAAKLIAEGKRSKKEKSSGGSQVDGDSELGFPFASMPCKSEASHAFAEAIYRMRSRRQNLCMVTPRGTPVRAIAEDFFSWMNQEETGYSLIEPSEFSFDKLAGLAGEAKEKNWKSLVVCIPETDHLDPGQQKQLARGSRKGAFSETWDGTIRFLFMIGSDVETLYQEGTLSDELYLSMGGAEIHVPPLRECPEDIEHMARTLETDSGSPIGWESSGISALLEKEWPGNHAELRKVLLKLQQNHSGRPLNSRDVIDCSSEDENASKTQVHAEKISLFETLDACRNSYLLALADLTEEGPEVVASIAGVPRELAEKILGE